MKVKKAVILCGGYETRMLPVSKSVPKTMLPVVDRPIIHCIIEELADAGIEEIAFIIDENKQPVKHYFSRNEHLESYLKNNHRDELLDKIMPILSRVKINFIVREIDCGPGFAISLAKDVIGKEPFMLYLSDELVLTKEKSCAQQLIDAYEKYQSPVMAIQPVPEEFVRRYGIIDGKKIAKGIYSVSNIIEKPEPQDAPSNLSFMGSAILTKEVFEEIERQREKGNFDVVIPYTFKPLFESGKMIACEIKGKRQDMGNKFGFIKANIEAGLEREDIKEELAQYIKDLAKTL